MPFGQKARVGNFSVLKYTKSLTKREVEQLRTDIAPHIRKHLQRGGLPYIKVEAISGIWAIEFCCNTNVFGMIDGIIGSGDKNKMTTLAHIFNMWYMDTCLPGDAQYQEDKAKAIKGYMNRCNAKAVSKEEDDKTLDELRADEEHRAAIVDMAQKIKEDGHEGDE